MMPSLLGNDVAGIPHAGLSNDALLNELSRHLSAANTRRYTKGSNGLAPRSGNVMRITKPSSANNSPQSAILQARRRTMMSDGLSGRSQPPALETYLPTPTASDIYQEPENNVCSRAARPVSWHSGYQHLSQLQNQPQSQTQQSLHQPAFPAYTEPDFYPTMLDLPPTPAAYSGFASPASNFSPLALPYSNFGTRHAESQGYFAPAQWSVSSQQPLPALESASISRASSSGAPCALSLPSMSPEHQRSSVDWHTLPTHGFNVCTAPPTPDNAMPLQQSVNAKLAREDAIPYQPLEAGNDESEGEILYGMGLYDAPERQAEDAQWRYHRSTVLSLLGGAAPVPEPRGRGLKLEDAWEPPASDGEDEDEEDQGDQVEGDDEGEEDDN